MDILVFSKNKKTRELFKIKRKGAHFSLPEFISLGSMDERLKEAVPGSLVYLDIAGISEKETRQFLRSLSKNAYIHYGVLDAGGKISDVAELFHDGAVDYLGKAFHQNGITSTRLNRIHEFIQLFHRQIEVKEKSQKSHRPDFKPSGDNWENVVSGREYTFFMLYIELDGKEELEKRYERDNLDIALNSFRKYVESSFAPFGGRLFIWFRFGGLLLFPFGSRTEISGIGAFHYMVYKHLYDVEGSRFPHILSIRLAMHVGNTVYRRNNTGHIVSDSLNTVFHLGQQYTNPGTFTVTQEAFEFIDPRLEPYFVESGTFENRRVYRLRLLNFRG